MLVIRIGRRRVTAASANGLAPVHAADAQLVDVVHEHDAVIHDDADEHDHAEHREQVDLQPRNEQREEAAGERERDREHDDERRFEILELRDHHEIYEQDTDREPSKRAV